MFDNESYEFIYDEIIEKMDEINRKYDLALN